MTHKDPTPRPQPGPSPEDLSPADKETKQGIYVAILAHVSAGRINRHAGVISAKAPTDNPNVEYVFGKPVRGAEKPEDEIGVVGTVSKRTKVAENVYENHNYAVTKTPDGTLELSQWLSVGDQRPVDHTDDNLRTDELMQKYRDGEINDAEVAWGVMEIRREAREAAKARFDEEVEAATEEAEAGIDFVSQTEAKELLDELDNLKPPHLKFDHGMLGTSGIGITAILGSSGLLDKPFRNSENLPPPFKPFKDELAHPAGAAGKFGIEPWPIKPPMHPSDSGYGKVPFTKPAFHFGGYITNRKEHKIPKNQVETGSNLPRAKFKSPNVKTGYQSSDSSYTNLPDELRNMAEEGPPPPPKPTGPPDPNID
jgi:hypothetical protein